MSEQKPSIGRIVHYTLDQHDVERIKERQRDDRYVGNPVRAGDVYPMIIIRTWDDHGSVNGQLFLDGPDTLWVTSVSCGEGERHWAWPPRV